MESKALSLREEEIMQIQLYFTVPTAFLHLFEKVQDLWFIEAEIARTDSAYRDYFSKHRDAFKKYVVLDNSAYLLNKPVDTKMLEKIIDFYNPDCVIAPDYPYDWVKTLKATEEFTKTFGHFDIKIMGVPQGKSYSEYMSCFYRMIENPRINVIGINMFMNWEDTSFDRLNLNLTEKCCRLRTMILWQISNQMIRCGKTIHLLGITTGREISFCVKHNLKCVKSCDSSSAFHHGYLGVRYGKEGIVEKDWTKLEFSTIKKLNEKQTEDITHNVKRLRVMRDK